MKKIVKAASIMLTASMMTLLLNGCTSGEGDAGKPAIPMDTVIDQFGAISETLGPGGEKATHIPEMSLTAEQKAELMEGGFRAAVLWHEQSSWTMAVDKAMSAEFDELGIQKVATTDAKMDPVTQANQVLTTLALKPDAILSLAIDPSTDAAAYQVAADAGVKLIFAEQAPDGFTHGKEFQSVITDDLYKMAQTATRAMCEAVGSKGEIGMIYYDIKYHATNFKDAVFQQALKELCPNVTIVAKSGFSTPDKSEEVANAMISRRPNLDGIYVSWVSPAQGVLAALRSAGNTKTKIVTYDLDDTMATDMASGGNSAATMIGDANQYGRGMALSAAYAILGLPAPAFAVVDPVLVTKDSIIAGYEAWGQKVPSSVQSALDANK